MAEVTKWMQDYEEKNKFPTTERTKDFDSDGHCFGFSGLILASVAISDEIMRKKKLNPSYKPKDGADTLDATYARFEHVTKVEIPSNTASKEEQKKFYQEMQIFRMEIEQAQHGIEALDFAQDQQKSMDILSPKSAAKGKDVSQDLQVLHTYYFTQPESLAKWAEKARPGDMLDISSGNHAMAMYAREDEKGGVIIGFYDPNKAEKNEVLRGSSASQRLRMEIALDIFDPFHYKENGSSVFACKHIVSSNKGYKPLDEIADDILTNKKEQNDAFSQAMLAKDGESIKKFAREYKIDVNAKDENGRTNLHVAVSNGDVTVVTALIAAGADLSARNSDGDTPLHTAATKDNTAVTETLIAAGADLNARNSNEVTPLFNAATCKKMTQVKTLITAGADVNITSRRGISALDMAMHNKDTESTKALINAKDKNGNTPLSLAVSQKNEKEIIKLIELGADVNVKDKNGNTPLSIAVNNKDKKIITTLITTKTQDGDTPLHTAVHNMDAKGVQALVAAGADLNAKDKNDKTPLICALDTRNYAAANHLLAKDENKQSICQSYIVDQVVSWASKSNNHKQKEEMIKHIAEVGKCGGMSQDKCTDFATKVVRHSLEWKDLPIAEKFNRVGDLVSQIWSKRTKESIKTADNIIAKLKKHNTPLQSHMPTSKQQTITQTTTR